MTAPNEHFFSAIPLSVGALRTKADPKRAEPGVWVQQSAPCRDAQAPGFTLIEMLFAIFIFVILLGLLAPVFTQALHASQETATEARMQELAKGTSTAYAKDAMVVDTTRANGTIVFTSGHGQWIGNGAYGININMLTNGTATVTPTQAYTPGHPQGIQPGFAAIAGAAGNSPLHLATDGFGQPVWIYVSPEMEAQYDGYALYFHDVGFLSTNGLPAGVTPQTQGVTYTCTVDPSHQRYNCAFDLGTQQGAQHDLVTQVSGYAIEAHLYQVTLQRMHKVAQAYSSYFTTQYLANSARNADIDYFAGTDSQDDGPYGDGNDYMDTASTAIPNTGDNNDGGGYRYAFPGRNPDGSTVSYWGTTVINDADSAGTFDKGTIIRDLGLSMSAVTTAWGFQMGVGNGPNTPYGNCKTPLDFGSGAGTYAQDRDPLSDCAQLENPPYTAFIYAWAPSGVLLSDIVVGNY